MYKLTGSFINVCKPMFLGVFPHDALFLSDTNDFVSKKYLWSKK